MMACRVAEAFHTTQSAICIRPKNVEKQQFTVGQDV
jgi:hypothetical protein